MGRVSRNQSEDVCALLRELNGAPHVELRVYHRSHRSGEEFLPGTEAITVPVEMLPDLIRMLEHTQEQLVQEGVAHQPSGPEAITMHAGEATTLDTLSRLARRRDSRQQCRVPIVVPIGCRPLEGEESGKAVTGETEDVSAGGAQIWISERFSLFSRVEVFMRIAGENFQGRAQVIGAEAHPEGGRYRHSLKWVDLNAEATAVLSKLAGSMIRNSASGKLSLQT